MYHGNSTKCYGQKCIHFCFMFLFFIGTHMGQCLLMCFTEIRWDNKNKVAINRQFPWHVVTLCKIVLPSFPVRKLSWRPVTTRGQHHSLPVPVPPSFRLSDDSFSLSLSLSRGTSRTVARCHLDTARAARSLWARSSSMRFVPELDHERTGEFVDPRSGAEPATGESSTHFTTEV